MKRRYNMPFGAQCLDDGSVRFRLWAPAAHQVELCFAGARTTGCGSAFLCLFLMPLSIRCRAADSSRDRARILA